MATDTRFRPDVRADLLRLVTHNVWVGQSNRKARRNTKRLARDTGHPHVIANQEATRFRGTIPDYQRVAVDPDTARHRDDLDCVLHVRDDVRVIRPRFVYVDGPDWRGPKHGLIHPPKVFVGATLEHEGRRWDVLNVHRTWTHRGRVNMESWDAEDDRLATWLHNRSLRSERTRPVIALGDWNGNPRDRGVTSISRLASDVGATCAFKGIDGALGVNVRYLSATEMDGLYGSDGHHPVLVEARAVKR